MTNWFYNDQQKKELYAAIKRDVKIVDYARNVLHFTLERKGRYYSVKEHDSLRIDPVKNCFWRNSGLGDRSAGSIIDFVMNFKGCSLPEAINELRPYTSYEPYYSSASSRKRHEVDRSASAEKNFVAEDFFVEHCFSADSTIYDLKQQLSEFTELLKTASPDDAKFATLTISHLEDTISEYYKKSGEEPLDLPEKADNMKRMFAYLCKSRYLDPEVVKDLVSRKMLYQDVRGNCVFVSYSSAHPDVPVCASLRGTNTKKRFLGDVKGCDYDFPFFIPNGGKQLIVTESYIDALSLMSIMHAKGMDYKKYDYLPLSGSCKDDIVTSVLSKKCYEGIYLSLDNDESGQKAMREIIHSIDQKNIPIWIVENLPAAGKDWNEVLTRTINKGRLVSSIEPFCGEVLDATKITSAEQIPSIASAVSYPSASLKKNTAERMNKLQQRGYTLKDISYER